MFLDEFYGEEQIKAFFDILPTPPVYTTLRVNTLLCSTTEAFSLLTKHFASRNEPFVVELNSDFPDVLMIRAIGPNQLFPSEKEIIVDTSCASALLRGADLFCTGIMGMDESTSSGDLVSVWADLDQTCSKGLKKKFLGRKTFIGNGICQVNRSNIFKEDTFPTGIGVKMVEMVYKMPSLNGVLSKVLYLQNLPSIAVSMILNPALNSKVLDMCASPGGKTCHIAAIMQNTGQIIAIDKNINKTNKISENCARFGIKNVQVMAEDSTKLIKKKIFDKEEFDFIVLDPPCSGIGQRPNLNFALEFQNSKCFDGFSLYQEKLFFTAWSLLKPGGQLIYSTCTVNPLENEVLIERILSALPDAMLLPIRTGFMKKYCLPGIAVASLDQETCDRCICRFFPSHLHDTIGFFIAKFQKKL